jgi:hypothetical protein
LIHLDVQFPNVTYARVGVEILSSSNPTGMLADAIAALGDEMVRVPAGEPVRSS